MEKRYKKSEPLNRWVALIMALISIFMGTVFSCTLILKQPIDREDATELTCNYKEFIVRTRRSSIAEIKLLFYDGPAQYIDGSCANDKLVEALEKVPVGTTLKMLINPNNDYVVELISNDETLLDFDYAQKELERNGVGFFYLGIAMYGFAIFFIIQAILDFRKKIKRRKLQKANNSKK